MGTASLATQAGAWRRRGKEAPLLQAKTDPMGGKA
jgi:hypothetical protein